MPTKAAFSGAWTGGASRVFARRLDTKSENISIRHRQASQRHLDHLKTVGPTMCGVIGILLADREAQVSPELYDGLTILQHRGQDAAGIATSDGGKMFLRKDKGLVRVPFALVRTGSRNSTEATL